MLSIVQVHQGTNKKGFGCCKISFADLILILLSLCWMKHAIAVFNTHDEMEGGVPSETVPT